MRKVFTKIAGKQDRDKDNRRNNIAIDNERQLFKKLVAACSIYNRSDNKWH